LVTTIAIGIEKAEGGVGDSNAAAGMKASGLQTRGSPKEP